MLVTNGNIRRVVALFFTIKHIDALELAESNQRRLLWLDERTNSNNECC